MTSFTLAYKALEENQPIDHQWLRNVYYSFKNEKERREWAKGCLEVATQGNESPQLIGRATTEFLKLVKSEI